MRLQRAVASCLVLTLTYLSFVAEVHVHPASAPALCRAPATLDSSAPSSVPAERSDDCGKGNGGDPSSTCPICQVLAFGTAALAPGEHVLLVLDVTRSDTLRVERALPAHTIATSFDWESRAPPLS